MLTPFFIYFLTCVYTCDLNGTYEQTTEKQSTETTIDNTMQYVVLIEVICFIILMLMCYYSIRPSLDMMNEHLYYLESTSSEDETDEQLTDEEEEDS